MTLAAILSPFGVAPIALMLMGFVSVHMAKMERQGLPPSRRRIRVANGWVMLIAIPLIGAGFSLIDPHAQTRAFFMIWTFSLGLIFVSVSLALLDILNTMRLAWNARRRLRSESLEALLQMRIAEREPSDPA